MLQEGVPVRHSRDVVRHGTGPSARPLRGFRLQRQVAMLRRHETDILEKARDWNDGQAKKRLLAAFTTLDDAELVGRYRRRMASLLF